MQWKRRVGAVHDVSVPQLRATQGTSFPSARRILLDRGSARPWWLAGWWWRAQPQCERVRRWWWWVNGSQVSSVCVELQRRAGWNSALSVWVEGRFICGAWSTGGGLSGLFKEGAVVPHLVDSEADAYGSHRLARSVVARRQRKPRSPQRKPKPPFLAISGN